MFEDCVYVAEADGYSSMRPIDFGDEKERLLSSIFYYPVELGTSGAPVFNNEGLCIGIVVATDHKEETLFINYLWIKRWENI